jgi:hypothetical protein
VFQTASSIEDGKAKKKSHSEMLEHFLQTHDFFVSIALGAGIV